MICNKCNQILPDDSEFCQYCGNKIEINTEVISSNEESDIISTINEETKEDSNEELVKTLFKFHATQTINTMKVNEQNRPNNENGTDFGLVPEKPIYTLALKSVNGEKEYLNKLYTSNGEKITYNRRGSMKAEGVNGMIDIYDTFLPSGQPYKTIYINMYGAFESNNAPIGFSFNNNVKKKQKVKKQKVIKTKYCTKCGSAINSKTKTCSGCGKRTFRYDIVIACILIVLIISLSCIVVSKYQKNKLVDEQSTTSINNAPSTTINNNSTAEKTYTPIYKGDYIPVTINDLYNNPQKYNGRRVVISAYNIFYLYSEPTYSENFYDMYLMQNLSNNVDNSQSGLDTSWSSQFIAFHNLISKKQPHIIARIFEQHANNVTSGSKIYSEYNLTNKYVTVYGYFTYNPDTEGYISDPQVYQIKVHEYKFH